MGSCVSRCYDKDRSKKYEEEQKVEPKKMPV